MCQAWTHISGLSQIEVGRTSEQGRTHGELVLIQHQHAKSIQILQDQEETYPKFWGNDVPMGWNWYLVSQHTKECPEAATQESCKKQAQLELARQQAQ
jgi:hypothetical protein